MCIIVWAFIYEKELGKLSKIKDNEVCVILPYYKSVKFNPDIKIYNLTIKNEDKLNIETNVDKDTILNLAKKLQQSDLKDEGTLREVIQTLSKMTGKEVTKEQEEKIINKVVNDKVPKDIDKLI